MYHLYYVKEKMRWEYDLFAISQNYARIRGTLSGIVQDVLALQGRGIIQLGLLLLIATPIARVAFSVAAFAFQRDRL